MMNQKINPDVQINDEEQIRLRPNSRALLNSARTSRLKNNFDLDT